MKLLRIFSDGGDDMGLLLPSDIVMFTQRIVTFTNTRSTTPSTAETDLPVNVGHREQSNNRKPASVPEGLKLILWFTLEFQT